MIEKYEKLKKIVNEICKKTDFKPEMGIVLGSGLGEYARYMDIKAKIAFSELEGFPVSTVEGHDGYFLFGYVQDVPMVMMKGRVHYYEGYDITDVVLPIRVMGMLGAKVIMLTNAAGGVNLEYEPGDLMMIMDHISQAVPSPLRGTNIAELGTRFPDMSNVYNKDICAIIEKTANDINIKLKKGVYMQCSGPNYETPAEIRMFRTCGIDAVGMSTVCEAVAAHHMGVKVCGISCITNMAAGILNQPLDHKEVQDTANQVKTKFESLVTESIIRIHKALLEKEI